MYQAEIRKELSEMSVIIEQCVENALLGEVMTTPKPGLVDLHDSGAHTDMDYCTFEASTYAIAPYICRMFREGYCWMGKLHKLFPIIREIGKQAEQAMFRATGGVNTHKGIIFTMGILSASAGYCYKSHNGFYVPEILELSQTMTCRTIVEEFEEIERREPATHGEKLYRKYGERGIRGEAMEGFPIIRDVAYPMMKHYKRKYRNDNLINLNVLLYILTSLRDTNVLSRGSATDLIWIQGQAEKILDMGGAASMNGYQTLLLMNQECIEKNISPGGAADILAATLFLYQLEELSRR